MEVPGCRAAHSGPFPDEWLSPCPELVTLIRGRSEGHPKGVGLMASYLSVLV